MLLRILAKLLFKATIPLFLIAGIFTYGYYMKGGDPASLWAGAGSGVMKQLSSLFSGVKDDASRAAASVSQVAGDGLGAVNSDKSVNRKVYTWTDADGVTHYSSVAPNGTQSATVSVNPDQNVMAPIKVPKVPEVVKNESVSKVKVTQNKSKPGASSDFSDLQGEASDYADPEVQDVADQLGGELPGVVGKILSSQSGDGAGSINPKQLIKMLQSN